MKKKRSKTSLGETLNAIMQLPVSKPNIAKGRTVRARAVILQALQWKGGDYKCLELFCGMNWGRADVHDLSFDDPEQVVIFNTKLQQWLHLPVGYWLICGTSGELFPIAPETFEIMYENVEDCA